MLANQEYCGIMPPQVAREGEIVKITLLFISLLLLFVTTGSAQNNNNTIHGKVRGMNGATVNNAVVELWLNGALINQTATRTDGDFYFASLAPAEYEVVVTASGFEVTTQSARFMTANRTPMGDILTIEVSLRPKTDAREPPPGVQFAQDVPKAAREAFEEGVEKIRTGKSDEGLLALRKALEIFKDYFAANFVLATELFRLGKDQEALDAVERARLINDREAAVYHLFGLIMFKQGKYLVADYGFIGAIKLNANFAMAHLFRGKTLIEIGLRNGDEKLRVGDFAEAEKELAKAWELTNKRLSEVYLHRARLHEIKGDKESAAKSLEAFLKAEPASPNATPIKEKIASLRKK
jgi:Tfp pilus assembly protein PilF